MQLHNCTFTDNYLLDSSFYVSQSKQSVSAIALSYLNFTKSGRTETEKEKFFKNKHMFVKVLDINLTCAEVQI